MLSILVIDDNQSLQLAFTKILSSAGYHIGLASDGEEGLRLARENIPDLIVLDMLLPKLGGVEVLRALKRDPATKKIPVIALSGLPRSNEAKLLREGAVSYLEKERLEEPVALLHAVEYALMQPRQDEFQQASFQFKPAEVVSPNDKAAAAAVFAQK
jgi:CheY-like chemotaxis protein